MSQPEGDGFVPPLNPDALEGLSLSTSEPLQPRQLGTPVPRYIQEINRLSNTVLASATIAMIRALASPSTSADGAEAAARLPSWFRSSWTSNTRAQSFFMQASLEGLSVALCVGSKRLLESGVSTHACMDFVPELELVGIEHQFQPIIYLQAS